jgi:hypothetical protein
LAALMADANAAEFQRKVAYAFYACLLIAGIAVFWIWGIIYNIWYPFTSGNIGVYTIYVPLIVFGILGLLMYRKPAKESQKK